MYKYFNEFKVVYDLFSKQIIVLHFVDISFFLKVHARRMYAWWILIAMKNICHWHGGSAL